MQTIILKIQDNNYPLLLQFLQTLSYVEIVKPENSKTITPKYDFSDIVGKLQWRGNAVEEQRRLRDEW